MVIWHAGLSWVRKLDRHSVETPTVGFVGPMYLFLGARAVGRG